MKKWDKKFWATSFTLTGTIIGAGILGLPYVFSRSGFLIGLMWLLILGGIVMYTFLCLGETSLRTKDSHQLPWLAKRYLGRRYQWIMLFAVIFGIYTALIAYLIGESQSLSILFTNNSDNAIYFALGFWLIMAFFLKEGLKNLRKIETYGVLAIILIIIIILFWYYQDIDYGNLININLQNVFLPFGVVLFALMGFTSIPELEMVIKGSEKKFKKAIILGVLMPIIIYVVFSLIFVGVLGTDVPQVSTTGLGKLVILLGIFTMLTSYFILSLSLKDVFRLDFGFSRTLTFVLVSIVPLVIYLTMYKLQMLSFIKVIGIGGVISGGLTGILILFIAKNAKEMGDRKPEYEIPINWFIIGLLSLIFIFGIVVQLLF